MEENSFLNKKQIIKTDHFILWILKDLLLNKNFSYVDIRNFIDDSVLEDLKCIKSDIEMRVMYNYWMWYLELLEISEQDYDKINEKCLKKNINPEIFFEENINWNKIFNKELFYSYFLEIKITATWLKRIEELEKEIGDNKWINEIFNYIKSVWEFLGKVKYIVWIGITLVLILAIFVFDVKVSEYIKKIPLLTSIVNTDILEAFEKVNDNDEFYKEIKKELKINDLSDKRWTSEIQGISFGENNDSMNPSKIISRKLWLNIEDIKVKNISPNEKLFRMTFQNWEQRFIKVLKGEDGRFRVE
ncbi:MAG: hypothetical protein ACD_4C00435G0002 [uncultured bacterium (gcode 4)]|uniref:Uncharacterized protein n=1 Tax=uncultured bacterium (gcode 4) TaxID=1234023 RepID=K2GS37_9BACT|nr:MAG: hypothetical protein ACD_4C00435G0002 [uncultured bacterium (gcode 4)]